jgi:hypothetical protein
MGELLQPMHVLVLLFVAGTLLIPAIFYILTLSGVLQKCAPASRTIEPGPIWILLIPLVNLVFSFIVVFEMAQTLRNEFNRRGIRVAEPSPGKSLGLAMCICGCCRIIPVLGLLAMLAHLVLWIIYWVKISEYSRMLDTHSMSIAGGHVV